MLTKLSHAEYDCFETISSENIECPIDIEYALPDYCPDIQKVLKCIPYPEISSYSFTPDKLMCEGRLTLFVQYMDGKSGTIRVCEISKEYATTKELPQSAERCLGRITPSCGHIICRAISARKLDIHVPVILTTSLCSHKHDRITCDVENLEKHTELATVSHAVNAISHQFVLENQLELSGGCPPVESILRKSATVNSLKCLCTQDKVQLEGTVDICVIYRTFSENLSVEKMQYTLPFSQSIDAAGVDADCVCTWDVSVCEFSLQPKEDATGECTLCNLYLKLDACVHLYKEKEISVIVDAYATNGKGDMHYQNANLSHFDGRYEEKLGFSKTIFLAEDELEKLLDIWCEDVTAVPYCEKNKISYRGKYSLCFTYLGKSKQLFTVQKTYDFTCAREFQEIAQRRSEVRTRLTIKDYRIVDGNNIEVNCEGLLISEDYSTQQKRILSSAEFTQDATPPTGKLVVYYSSKEEDLWEIGKQYAVPVAAVIENNSLQDAVRSPGGPLAIF